MVGRILFSGSVLALWVTSAFASNIVSNGAFTTGDFTNWNNSGWGLYAFPSDSGDTPTDTSYAANTGCVGAQCSDPNSPQAAFISQSLATVASQTYDLQFLYDAGPGAGPGNGVELDVFWDGNLVSANTDAAADTWIQYTFTDLTASTNSTLLEFTGRQDPAGLYLTDISVTPSAPEPASLLLLGGGLLSMSAMLRRRRRAPR